MKIHHLRNAAMVIESGNHHILVDPMLSDKDRLPPFARWRHRPRPNPTVSLPDNGLDLQVAIPEDGETLAFAPVNDRSKTPSSAAPQPAENQRASRGS